MADINVTLNSNAELFRNALPEQVAAALEEIGIRAEAYATLACPVDTGTLRKSIAHARDDTAAYIGTNVKYAPFVELGTGIFAEKGGRKTPWSYKDAKGHWHKTSGMKPQPFLRPALQNHIDEYEQVVKTALQSE